MRILRVWAFAIFSSMSDPYHNHGLFGSLSQHIGRLR
jgi:hypothetical protein